MLNLPKLEATEMKMLGFRSLHSYDPLILLCTCMLLMHANFQIEVCCANLGNTTDMLALLYFKEKVTSDPFQAPSSWNMSLHFCQWKGVTCGRRHQRVTSLDLSSLKLSGSLPAHIGNLSFLRILKLSNNSLTGEVPREIGRLFRLQRLLLQNNSFEGHIPANLSGCSQLRELVLQYNNFTGHVPFELVSLTKLLVFNVRANYLSGTIPAFLGNSSAIQELMLGQNQLEGHIPESLGQLKSLIILVLEANKLSGAIPSSLYNLSSVTSLHLAYNQFEGTLPRNLGHKHALPNLKTFAIFRNQFSGTIPASLSNASRLEYLDLSDNRFVGKVQIDFGNMKNLNWLELHSNNLGIGDVDDLNFITSLTNCSHLSSLEIGNNNFGGVLPHSLANLSITLDYLNFQICQISGNIPQGIGNLVGLEVLSLSYNQLTGSIPETFGNLYKLQQVFLAVNQLSGWIPLSIGNFTSISLLSIFGNNLDGRIPTSLGNCHALQILELSDNKLTGRIPREILGLPSLSVVLNLSENHLSGLLPSEVGQLTNLAEFDISRNNLSGEIPSSLDACTSLVLLYMNDNSFSGSIPNSLGSLKGIGEIDLSLNNLTGELPKSLSTLSVLQKLNLSYNDLEGEVPLNGVFANMSALSVIGNNKLCGGIPALHLPKCSASELRKHKMPHLVTLLISLTCGLLGLALVSSLVLISRNKKARKQPQPTVSLVDPFVNLSYGDIFRATNGFSSQNLIGMGNFGSVYKGILEPQKQIVAVKVLNLQAKGASKSFMVECEAIRNIRHRNLVRVITACSGLDYRGNDFKALVYEFMPNGSLEIWLYPLLQAGNVNHEEPKTLSLLQRLNVIIDVAAALNYLHNHCEVPIFHRNLHPSNILLDDDMTAHVTDFGLAKMVDQCENEMLQSQSSSSCSKARIGYAPPEYNTGCSTTSQVDVYSFGIIILEIFTGKRPTDDRFMHGLNLHNVANMALRTGVMEIVDRALLWELERKKAIVLECLTAIFELGVACSEELPQNRPGISLVTNELSKIKNLLLKDGNARHI